MNTDKPVFPAISFAPQKYQAMNEPRTEATLHPSSEPIPESFSSYEACGAIRLVQVIANETKE